MFLIFIITSQMLPKETLRYDSRSFSKELTNIIGINIKLILVTNKLYLKKNRFMASVDYKSHNNIAPLVVNLAKLNDFVKNFEEKKQMTSVLRKDFDNEPIYNEKYLIKKE